MPSSDLEDQAQMSESQDILSDKKVDLFDDNSLFKNLLKTTKADSISQPGKVNLFDSDEDEQNSTFSDKITAQSYENNGNKKGIRENYSPLFDEQPPVLKKIDDRSFQKTVTLFGDDDDLFKEDLFSANTKRTFTSGLFDDLDIQGDLFSQTVENKPINKVARNIFEDLLGTSDDKHSINENNSDGKNVAPTTVNDRTNISIFPETPEESNLFSVGDNVPGKCYIKNKRRMS